MNDPLTSEVHAAILGFAIDTGARPLISDLCSLLRVDEAALRRALTKLADEHGAVLHPHDGTPWVVHPISFAPTRFSVRRNSDHKQFWGNCAWCSFGLAALLRADSTITTMSGGTDELLVFHIVDGILQERDFFIHFPIPMRNAWENVIYTCSMMLAFRTEGEVDEWCRSHRIKKGDVRNADVVWEFAKVWYGNHLNPDWRKWSTAEASGIFARFGLTSPIWDVDSGAEKF